MQALVIQEQAGIIMDVKVEPGQTEPRSKFGPAFANLSGPLNKRSCFESRHS